MELSRPFEAQFVLEGSNLVKIKQTVAKPFGLLGDGAMVVNDGSSKRRSGVVDKTELQYKSSASVELNMLFRNGRKSYGCR